MARFYNKRPTTKDEPHGKAVFSGKKKMKEPIMSVINYHKRRFIEKEIKDIQEGAKFRSNNSITWINIYGLHDEKLIEELGDKMGLHSLVIEDIANTGQRAKLTPNDDSIFVVLKMLEFNDQTQKINSEQLSMVIADNFLITFQEKKGDHFEPVRERIRSGVGRIRSASADYLAYAILDTVADNYIYTVEKIGEKVEFLEDEIIDSQGPNVVDKLNAYKREMNYLRRTIRPAKEAIMKLSRVENDIINEKTIPYIKDLEELISEAAEAIDAYRDMLNDQLNIYHATLSNKMNEIMKVLTVAMAIFIPLTFLTGVYGMNFSYFPELHYKYGYGVFWLVVLVITFLMVRFFRKKDWF